MSSFQLTLTRAVRKFKDRHFELPMTRNYVAAWGFKEAIREILQNALDSESKFKWHYKDNVLQIISEDSKLNTKSLLLGATTKANDDSAIGSFGEGYKLALLVLTRNNFPVKVYNDGVLWTPSFRKSAKFGEECLHIDETWVEQPPKGLVFEIHNIPQYRMDDIITNCLPMQDQSALGKNLATIMGRIFVNQPGKLYVNGLFICNTNLKHSYDVKPEYINLERDRQTVAAWDLYNLSKEMWFLTERYDDIAAMIEESAEDMVYVQYDTPDVLKEFLYKYFKEKNPGKIAVKSQEELKRYVENGMTNVVVVSHQLYDVLHQVPDYKSSTTIIKKPTPFEELTKWYDSVPQGLLPTEVDEAFGKLLEKAARWM